MATLFDLASKPLADMTSDELQERLREMRRSRRTPPPSPAKVKAEKKTSVASMSSDEAAALLALLEGL